MTQVIIRGWDIKDKLNEKKQMKELSTDMLTVNTFHKALTEQQFLF